LWNDGRCKGVAMSKDKSKSGAKPKTDTRQKRLAEALRANLHKRKAQTRKRRKKDDA